MKWETEPLKHGDEKLRIHTHKAVVTWMSQKQNKISYSRRDWEVVETILYDEMGKNMKNLNTMTDEEKSENKGDNAKT